LKYEACLDEHHRLTFDQMIALTVENLRKRPEAGDLIQYLIVDEYQDINREFSACPGDQCKACDYVRICRFV